MTAKESATMCSATQVRGGTNSNGLPQPHLTVVPKDLIASSNCCSDQEPTTNHILNDGQAGHVTESLSGTGGPGSQLAKFGFQVVHRT